MYGMNDVYILAHAARNKTSQSSRSENVSNSKPLKVQNDFPPQKQEARKSCYVLPATPKSRACGVPLNIIFSKPAIRKPLQEENAAAPVVDLPCIYKNSELLKPSWRDKEDKKRSLQSAIAYNKRKADEWQEMANKMKYPRYRLDDVLPKPPRTKPLVMLSEDPLPDEISGDYETAVEPVTDEREHSVFSPNPSSQTIQKPFVWNPVITPRTGPCSALELLGLCYPTNGNIEKQHFDSPGNFTTSSSSDFTVAEEEETLRFTYYTERCRAPSYVRDRGRTRDDSLLYDPCGSVEEWRPLGGQPDLFNYFEE